MGLIAHYPLMGNTDNYATGIQHPVAYGTLEFLNEGKIGKCMTGNGWFNSKIRPCDLGSECSVAFWIYINATESDPNPIGNGILGGYKQNQDFSKSRPLNFYTFPKSGDFHYSMTPVVGETVSNNVLPNFFGYKQWVHTVVTFSSTKGTSVYRNGELFINHSYNKMNPTSDWDILVGANDSNPNPNVRLNDVRFYNHTLTPKEVKELAKAKLMHYKLDRPLGDNLIANSELNTYNNGGVPSNLWKTIATFEGKPIYRLTMKVTKDLDLWKNTLFAKGVFSSLRQTFTGNTKYCYQILYRPISHPDIKVGGTASNVGGWLEIPSKPYKQGWSVIGQYRNGEVTTDVSDYIYTSICCPSVNLNDEIVIEFCGQVLLQGTTYTDYDSMLGTRYHNIPDLSGYKLSGWANPVGNPKYNRAENCMEFDGKLQNIVIYSPPVNSKFEELTVTGWWYYEQGKTEKGVSSSNLFSLSNNFFIRSRLNGDDTLWILLWDTVKNKWEVFDTTTKLPRYRWVNVTYTFNRGCLKVYMNGILTDSFSTGMASLIRSSSDPSFLGGYVDSKENWLGKIREFRVYATALKEEDIREMYETDIYLNNEELGCKRLLVNNPVTNKGEKSMRLEVQSQGTANSTSKVTVNGNIICYGYRGINIARFDTELNFIENQHFDTYGDTNSINTCVQYFSSIPVTDIIVIYTKDYPFTNFDTLRKQLIYYNLKHCSCTFYGWDSYIAVFTKQKEIFYEGFCGSESAQQPGVAINIPTRVNCDITINKYVNEVNNRGEVIVEELIECVDDIEIVEKYGSKWAKIFYHDIGGGQVLWNSFDEISYCNQPKKYSRFGSLMRFIKSNGKYRFLLEYPEKQGYNMWEQSSHPITTHNYVEGFTPISLSWTTGFVGLSKSSQPNSTFLDCTDASSYWYALGTRLPYETSFIPGNFENVSKVVLYVEVERDNIHQISKNNLVTNKVNELI